MAERTRDLKAERRILRAMGNTIRDKRDERGLKSQEVAARAGIPAGTLSKVENGRQNVTVLTLSLIAHGLDCSLAELMPNAPLPIVTPPGDSHE
jgi:transcriptional regulator with XRE-family HTH domain